MIWNKKLAIDGPVATAITETSRVRGVSDVVRGIVTAEDTHAVVSWEKRKRVWEYWRQASGRWDLVGSYTSAMMAKNVAEQQHREDLQSEQVASMDPTVAAVMQAEWKPPYSGSGPIRIQCSTPSSALMLSEIFGRLGCAAQVIIPENDLLAGRV